MPDSDQKKTVILRKSDEKEPPRDRRDFGDGGQATHKQGQPFSPPKPAPRDDRDLGGRTEIIGGNPKPQPGENRLQAKAPPPPPPPAPEAEKEEMMEPDEAPPTPQGDRTRVFRPGARADTPQKEQAEASQPEQPPVREQPMMKKDAEGRIANPVVGWLVVVSGPGAGGYRAVFDGRNRIGRNASADVPLDFGDGGISREQATIHYDPKDRSFLFIPQLDVENFTYINQSKAINAVELKPLDEIEIAETTLRFVPLCGPNFDWSDLNKK